MNTGKRNTSTRLGSTKEAVSDGLFHTPFESLRKPPVKSKSAPPIIPAEKKQFDPQKDEEAFAKAMADVREIKEFRDIPAKKSAPLKPFSSNNKSDTLGMKETLETLRQIVTGRKRITLSDTDEYIEWVNPDIRADAAYKLHKGHFSVQDFIDLHGYTREEAEIAFAAFFREALAKGLSCIKVIHGRGLRSQQGPVLKEALKKWLHGPYRKRVAAYATARDCDGGLGATYVLLKSH